MKVSKTENRFSTTENWLAKQPVLTKQTTCLGTADLRHHRWLVEASQQDNKRDKVLSKSYPLSVCLSSLAYVCGQEPFSDRSSRSHPENEGCCPGVGTPGQIEVHETDRGLWPHGQQWNKRSRCNCQRRHDGEYRDIVFWLERSTCDAERAGSVPLLLFRDLVLYCVPKRGGVAERERQRERSTQIQTHRTKDTEKARQTDREGTYPWTLFPVLDDICVSM